MKISLSDHFSYAKLIRFVVPSVLMMVFTSIYGVVDGFFVSNFAGKVSFAAINLIMPFLMLPGGVGFMIGTGGSALVAKTLGEGDREKANRIFSMMVYLTLALGVLTTVLGIAFIRPVALLLGATESMLPDCIRYGRIILLFNTAFMLQSVFQSFLITAEKPKLGLAATVAAGVTNMLLDALLVGLLSMGVVGAALATGISQLVGGALPLLYFAAKNSSLLRLIPTAPSAKLMLRACANGSSEMMSNISASLVSMLYNFQLLHYAGENGVAAYGVLMYVQFIFIAIFVGYSIGCAPIVGFHYGAGNHAELKSLRKKSLLILSVLGGAMALLALLLSDPMARIFVSYDRDLLSLTERAFRIFSLAFLFAGINIFASSFFTALNNGAVSALLSFLRTLLFQSASVILLPMALGIDGVWWSVAIAELFALILSSTMLIAFRKRYHY